MKGDIILVLRNAKGDLAGVGAADLGLSGVGQRFTLILSDLWSGEHIPVAVLRIVFRLSSPGTPAAKRSIRLCLGTSRTQNQTSVISVVPI